MGLQGEREAKDLELEQSRKTLRSLGEQVKKLTTENASLLDRMRKFGGLQNESRELSHKVGKLQEELKKVSAERAELKFLLEATQAQVNVSIMYIHSYLGLCCTQQTTAVVKSMGLLYIYIYEVNAMHVLASDQSHELHTTYYSR